MPDHIRKIAERITADPNVFLEKKLTSKKRKSLPSSSFVFPKERKYPIHDISHARNALSRVAQHGTPEEKKKVKAAVQKRYPSIQIDESVDRSALAKVAQALASGHLGKKIQPYDLWLAMGKRRRVPQEVIKSRSGMTPEQLVQRAISDLEQMDFTRKDIVLRILKAAIQ